uniref:Ig-like domain-containing protein n=1 Tax=Gopherus agassizii TaxID=38772 RepID=A0A452I864_9SAUR
QLESSLLRARTEVRVGESCMEDAVTQTQLAASGVEDGSVALGCTYETDSSYYSLYWYKQHGAEKLVFLLWGYSGGLKKNEAGKRFSADFKKFESLRITGLELRDSATYFCAFNRDTW